LIGKYCATIRNAATVPLNEPRQARTELTSQRGQRVVMIAAEKTRLRRGSRAGAVPR